jgi:hypothetical protein
MSKEGATAWAAAHKAEGWAMVGDSAGNATYDEVCQTIYKYKFVLAGIPVYENYSEMEGGDGSFPEPRGAIAGYHALAFYSYSPDKLGLIHSWGDYCGRFGSISREYFNATRDESVYLVIIDSSDVAIARDNYKSLTITVKAKDTGLQISADIYVNGVLIGLSPLKIAVESGKSYEIEVKFMGYISQKKVCGDSEEEVLFELEHNTAPVETKTWWQLFLNFLNWLRNLFRGKK